MPRLGFAGTVRPTRRVSMALAAGEEQTLIATNLDRKEGPLFHRSGEFPHAVSAFRE
jgi:hypothetical protein